MTPGGRGGGEGGGDSDDAELPWGPVEAGSEGPGSPGRLERRPVHQGRILRLSLDRVRFPGGSEGELEFVAHPGASAVLAILGDPHAPDPEVVLVRQYRYATGGYLYEVPAGMPARPGEPWEAVARRELREETGYEAERMVYLTRIHTTPGFTDEVIRIYAALGLTPGTAGRDDDEFMDVVPMPLSRALEMARTGAITDAKTLVTLLWGRLFLRGRLAAGETLPEARE